MLLQNFGILACIVCEYSVVMDKQTAYSERLLGFSVVDLPKPTETQCINSQNLIYMSWLDTLFLNSNVGL